MKKLEAFLSSYYHLFAWVPPFPRRTSSERRVTYEKLEAFLSSYYHLFA
ncbi:MAG: hypothetical protein MSF32_05790 [Dysosmobacter sp.]|nr:hypothetical protein [Dysosmobacter sp.]